MQSQVWNASVQQDFGFSWFTLVEKCDSSSEEETLSQTGSVKKTSLGWGETTLQQQQQKHTNTSGSIHLWAATPIFKNK